MNLLQKNNGDLKWIIDNFPENYQNLFYINLDFDINNFFLYKEQSKEELLNITEDKKYLYEIRDNFELFLSSYKNDSNDKNVNSFIKTLIENKVISLKNSNNKSLVEEILVEIKSRLENSYILNKNFNEILDGFDSDEYFIYFNFLNISESNMQFYIDLCNLFKKNKSKIMIHSNPSLLYSKMLKGWTSITVNYDKKTKNQCCIWYNY